MRSMDVFLASVHGMVLALCFAIMASFFEGEAVSVTTLLLFFAIFQGSALARARGETVTP